MKQSIGIIGAGDFGSFAARVLKPYFNVKQYDRGNRKGDDLEAAAGCDAVVLAIPLQAYSDVLTTIKPYLRKDTVVVDVCSVKEEPLKLLEKYLPDQRILATHPLFGPQSAASGLSGHTVIICPTTASPEALLASAEDFLKSLGLRVVRMSPAEHDKLMADLHALTFFVARALAEYGVDRQAVMTPSYGELLDLANLERHHSSALFETIQKGNRYAAGSRQKLMKIMADIEKRLQAD